MRSRRALPVLAAIVLSAPPAGAAETTGELPHYTLRVELHPAAQELVVDARIALPPQLAGKPVEFLLTQSLAVEWGRYGIRLNAIAPGPFPTKGAMERLSPGRDVDAVRAQSSDNPSLLARIGQMHELCNLAVLLMGPGADYINGQTIAIDGGQHLATQGGFARLADWGDAEWQAARDAIRSANEQDRAKRTT